MNHTRKLSYLCSYPSLFIALITQVHFSIYGITIQIISMPNHNDHDLFVLCESYETADKLLTAWENNRDNNKLLESYVYVLLEKREFFKREENFEMSDYIRNAFIAKGVKICDTKNGYRLE